MNVYINKFYKFFNRKFIPNTKATVSILALILYGIFIFFPMYWMFITAFKEPTIVMRIPPELFPSSTSLENFTYIFNRTQIFRWIWNSLLTSSIATLFYVFICAMAGYSFAQKNFPGNKVIFWLYISTLMLPYFSYLIPLYLLIVDFNFVNSYAGLILPAMSGPFGVFLMKQYMMNFPNELIQAAKIDGCNEFRSFWQIVIPICKPAVSFLGIVVFISQWNNFLWPMIVISSDRLRTIQVGIALFQQMSITDYGATMAASVVAALPIIILFLIFQRNIISGINIGAIKG